MGEEKKVLQGKVLDKAPSKQVRRTIVEHINRAHLKSATISVEDDKLVVNALGGGVAAHDLLHSDETLWPKTQSLSERDSPKETVDNELVELAIRRNSKTPKQADENIAKWRSTARELPEADITEILNDAVNEASRARSRSKESGPQKFTAAEVKTRPEMFDSFIGFACSAEDADQAYQELDYMWESVWSVKFSERTARFYSIKNALGIAIRSLASNVMKIGAVSAIVGAFNWVRGYLSL